MNKNLTKAIMVRSRLRNKCLKYKTCESRDAYKNQRNYCVTLLRETKISFYEHLNPKFIIDNKKNYLIEIHNKFVNEFLGKLKINKKTYQFFFAAVSMDLCRHIFSLDGAFFSHS